MSERMVETPEWLRRRYDDIRRAAIGEVGAWAQEYSHGYIKPDDGDFPTECPTSFPLIPRDDDDFNYGDWPHRDLYAEERDTWDTNWPGLTQAERFQRQADVELGTYEGPGRRGYHEFHFGTYVVFRVTKEELTAMNEGYDEPSDIERALEDGDGMIVVYIL